MSTNKEEERLARSMSRSRSKTSQGPTSPPASPTAPLLVDSPVASPLSPRGKFNINSPNPGKTSQRLSITPEEREKILEQRRVEDEQREAERRALAEKEKEMAFKRNSLKRSDLTNEKGSLLTQLRESLQPASNTDKDRIEKRLSIPRIWKKPEDSSKSPEAKSPEQSPIEAKKETEAASAQKNQDEQKKADEKKADEEKAAMEKQKEADRQRQESEKKAQDDQKKRDEEARQLEAAKQEEEKARKHQEDQAKEQAKRDEEKRDEEMKQLEEKTRQAALRDAESKSAASNVRADPIKADFCIHYVCDFGQSVAVIGTKAPLLNAIPLQWHDGHHWKVSLTLEDKNLEYHYLIMSNGSIVREEKRQHTFQIDSSEDSWLD